MKLSLHKIIPARLLLPIALLVVSGCNVHEWYKDEPEPGPSPGPEPPVPEMVPVTLNLNFDTALPLHKEVTYSRASQNVQMRYQVEIYAGSRSKGNTPMRTLTFTQSATGRPDFTTQLKLDDGTYEFYVWADYVDEGTTTDKYYNTQNWEYIVLPDRNNHRGSDEHRDAFRGSVMKNIVNAETVTSSNTVDVAMKRPLARFEFVATDYDKFVDTESRNRASEETSQTTGEDARNPEIDPSDYIVVFQYNGFMPSAYNLYTDKPNDAWQNVQFRGAIEPQSQGGARMGFDYVFVNGSETSVTIVMAVFDKNGRQLSQTRPIDVPLMRSKNTVVRGEFLSEKASGGVGIQPDFDGDFNIEID